MTYKLYNILGINKNASQSEIKKAYRKLAKKYHPDVNKTKEAEDKFKEINMAYEVLSDENRRKQYDQYGDDIFSQGTSNSSQQQHSQNSNFQQADFGDIDLDEIFSQMFGGGFNGGGFKQRPINPDIEAEVEIPLSIALKGGKLPLQTSSGSFTVNIPKDITHNDKIRIKGKGKNINGAKGDLYLYAKIIGDNGYDVKGYDIHKVIDVPLSTAIFGGKKEFDFFGEKITVKIPKDTSFGQKLKVKGKGLKIKKSQNRGDLILIINILIPKASTFNKEDEKVLKKDLNTNSFSNKFKNFFK